MRSNLSGAEISDQELEVVAGGNLTATASGMAATATVSTVMRSPFTPVYHIEGKSITE